MTCSTQWGAALGIKPPHPMKWKVCSVRSECTADPAPRLVCYFCNSPEFWLNLQAAYDLRSAERKAAARIERKVSPQEVA